ncbi:hypothetical protein, partial [[Clostridium] innocuum]|uniref:hypothetical protein n=1 Tax=Clostridium innocuum TaxID=1522 RepID=UPI001C37F82D
AIVSVNSTRLLCKSLFYLATLKVEFNFSLQHQKDSCFFAFTGKKWYIIIGNSTMQDMKEG